MADAKHPLLKTFQTTVPATAAGADAEFVLFTAPYACTVTSVKYTATTVLTGADTDSRTLTIYNRKGDASGTTKVAEKAYTAGVNSAALVPTAVTLSGTAANKVLAAGEVVTLKSLHVGAGLADPGGMIQVEISRN